jgi:hypothetical protein
MIFHSPLLNILINLVSVGKYNFLNWGTFVPQGTVYGVFLMGTVPGLKIYRAFPLFIPPEPPPRPFIGEIWDPAPINLTRLQYVFLIADS